MATVDQQVEERLEKMLSQVQAGVEPSRDLVKDILRWALHGPEIFSQFDQGFCGSVFRQSRTNVLMTIKVNQAGVPLVAFITSATTAGCIEQMFDLLYADKLKWQKDRYPWI